MASPKPRRLDRERPYGEIHGGARLRYLQDDILFDERGREIRDGLVAPPDEDEIPEIPVEAQTIDYSKLPIVQLKQVVEQFGARYSQFKNKAEAVAFLEGRIPAPSTDE